MDSEGVNLSWVDYPGIGDQIRDRVMYLFQKTPQEILYDTALLYPQLIEIHSLLGFTQDKIHSMKLKITIRR